MSAIEEIFDIELEKKQQLFDQQSSESNAPQMTIGEQCKAFRDIMMKQKEEAARKITRNGGTGD